MERIEKSTLKAVAGVMASSFADDPMHEVILERYRLCLKHTTMIMLDFMSISVLIWSKQ